MLPSILSLSVTVYRTQNAVPNSRSEKVNHLLGVHDTEKGPKRSSCQKKRLLVYFAFWVRLFHKALNLLKLTEEIWIIVW